MGIATVHIDTVDGFDTPARCFLMDPPVADPYDGQPREFVTIWVAPGYGGHHLPQTCVIGALENGASAYRSHRLWPGSVPLYGDPEDLNHAYWLALQHLGYNLEVS